MEKGVPIRSLSRGIAVLQAINRVGSMSMTEIARIAEVPYPTACRIVQTLVYEALIEREPTRKRYRPTALVQTLAHGFQGDTRLVNAARAHIVELTRQHGWPITLSVKVGHWMVLRDSTHALTTMTFNSYYPGYSVPILDSAAGIVALGCMAEEERTAIIDSFKLMSEPATAKALRLFESGDVIEQVCRDGFAVRAHNRFTRNPGKTSSIAVPILATGEVVGALTLAFFSSAIEMREAIDRFVAPLKMAAQAIGDDMARELRSSATSGGYAVGSILN